MSLNTSNVALLGLLVTLVTVSGCSSVEDSEIKDYETRFMSNCQAPSPGNSDLTALCECSFDEISSHFSKEELLGSSKAQEIVKFAQTTALNSCLAKK